MRNGYGRTLAGTSSSTLLDASRYVVADDSTDNTTGLAAAMTAATAAGGGLVQLPRGIIRGSVVIPANVILLGHGRATTLKAPAGFNGSVVSLASTAYGWGIRDLTVDGNYSNVTASNGVNLVTNGDVQSVSPSLYGGVAPDPVPHITNVFISGCKGTGMYVGVNQRELKARNVYTLYCDIGYDVTAHDANLTACSSGGTRYEGFRDRGRNNRYTACKSFYAGQDPVSGVEVTGRGIGFLITNEATQLTGCESQENADYGVLLDGTADQLSGTLINGHLFGGDRLSALCLKGNVAYSRIDGAIYQANRYTQGHGLTFDAVPQGYQNVIALHCGNGIDYSNGHPIRILNGGETRGHDITINVQNATNVVAYAASYTPTPVLNETIAMTLTGNLTVNNTDIRYTLPGQRLRFVFTQDATGTRTVTFGSQYKTSWTPSLLGGRTNVVDFINTGSAATPNWFQVAATVGLV